MEAYCIQCKSKRTMVNSTIVTMTNGKKATRGECSVCGKEMFHIESGDDPMAQLRSQYGQQTKPPGYWFSVSCFIFIAILVVWWLVSSIHQTSVTQPHVEDYAVRPTKAAKIISPAHKPVVSHSSAKAKHSTAHEKSYHGYVDDPDYQQFRDLMDDEQKIPKAIRIHHQYPEWPIAVCAGIAEGIVITGMSETQARLAWGAPTHIEKTTTEYSTIEIWQYGKYGERSLTFEDGSLSMYQE